MQQILVLIISFFSLPPGVPQEAYWICFRSATWMVVHDAQSSSYGNYIRDILAVAAFFIVIAARDVDRPAHEGVWAMIRRWIKALWGKAGGVGIIVFLLFTCGQWIYNFSQARDIFIIHRPFVSVFWNQNTQGFEVQRGVGTTITPEFRRDHRQYVAKVYYPTTTPMVHPYVDVLFEFPYFVSSYSINGDGCSPGTFSPVFGQSPLILPGGGTITLVQQTYRTWKLHIPYMNAGGYVRIVLNFDIAHDAETTHDPLDDYILTTTGFSYGERSETNETYAPFKIESDKTIKLQPTGPKPNNLRVEAYMY